MATLPTSLSTNNDDEAKNQTIANLQHLFTFSEATANFITCPNRETFHLRRTRPTPTSFPLYTLQNQYVRCCLLLSPMMLERSPLALSIFRLVRSLCSSRVSVSNRTCTSGGHFPGFVRDACYMHSTPSPKMRRTTRMKITRRNFFFSNYSSLSSFIFTHLFSSL